jgi:hypothetical protein
MFTLLWRNILPWGEKMDSEFFCSKDVAQYLSLFPFGGLQIILEQKTSRV